jgi:hypothetical protein
VNVQTMSGSHSVSGTGSACVYTTLIGNYAKLNEQPLAASSRLPFICLTDDSDLQSETWQIRHVKTLFGMDPVRSQRALKLRPHEYLSGFDASLYIDNSVLLKIEPEQLIERYLADSGFCLPEHSFRETLLEEFLEVEARGLDDPARIYEQLNHYMMEFPELLQERPYWTGILLRDHRNPKVRTMLELWWAHVQRYSRRDQLSINVALKEAGLCPEVLRIDNYDSVFHTWPHRVMRTKKRRVWSSATFSHPVARIKGLERQIRELEREHDSRKQALVETRKTLKAERRKNKALRASSWRLASRLRSTGEAYRSIVHRWSNWRAAGAHEPLQQSARVAASSHVADKYSDDISFLTTHRTVAQVINSIHVSLRFKYIYAETPKAACSSIKLFLMKNENPHGLFPFTNDPTEAEFEHFHLREFSPLLTVKQVYPFRGLVQSGKFFRFCFVRNPYERLVSAYLDKVSNNGPLAGSIKKMMGLATDHKADIHFEDFVDCVCHQTVAEMNSHWRIQYFHTYQDVIDYDYIGRVENMQAGIAHISKATSLDDRLFVRFNPHAQNSAEKLSRYLTPSLRQKIADKYALDFDYFRYASFTG